MSRSLFKKRKSGYKQAPYLRGPKFFCFYDTASPCSFPLPAICLAACVHLWFSCALELAANYKDKSCLNINRGCF